MESKSASLTASSTLMAWSRGDGAIAVGRKCESVCDFPGLRAVGRRWANTEFRKGNVRYAKGFCAGQQVAVIAAVVLLGGNGEMSRVGEEICLCKCSPTSPPACLWLELPRTFQTSTIRAVVPIRNMALESRFVVFQNQRFSTIWIVMHFISISSNAFNNTNVLKQNWV